MEVNHINENNIVPRTSFQFSDKFAQSVLDEIALFVADALIYPGFRFNIPLDLRYFLGYSKRNVLALIEIKSRIKDDARKGPICHHVDNTDEIYMMIQSDFGRYDAKLLGLGNDLSVGDIMDENYTDITMNISSCRSLRPRNQHEVLLEVKRLLNEFLGCRGVDEYKSKYFYARCLTSLICLGFPALRAITNYSGQTGMSLYTSQDSFGNFNSGLRVDLNGHPLEELMVDNDVSIVVGQSINLDFMHNIHSPAGLSEGVAELLENRLSKYIDKM